MLAEVAAAGSGAVFAAAQTELLARSTRLVAQALTNPSLLPSLPRRLRAEAQAVARAALERVPAIVTATIAPAATAGTAAGEASATEAGASVPWWVTLPGHQNNAAAKVAQDLTSELTAAADRITRFADDAYRAAVAEAAIRQVSGELTPKGAQQHAWRALMGQGITGFTDKAGRQWNLATYTEMAVRTASARAFRDSSRERMTAMGISFFTVSSTGRPCELCLPWEGQVLGSMGAGTFQEDGHTVDVAATVEEATAAGLFHPNCKHTLVAFRPGTSVLKAPGEWTAAAEAEYQNTQRLRALERQARAARTQYANALTPADRAHARQQVGNATAAIKAHTANTGLLRRPNREQPNLGFKPESPHSQQETP